MLTLIDTSSWIHALRPDGDKDARKRVEALLLAGDAAWCSMVRLELWNGARGEHEKRVLEALARDVVNLEIGNDVWNSACMIARNARSQGRTIPATDLLIAACAREYGAALEHSDAHFGQIEVLD